MRIIHTSELDRCVRWHAPPENQGQIVEVSYAGLYDGRVLRRTLDRSDRSVQFAVADLDLDTDDGLGAPPGLNGEPAVESDWEAVRIVHDDGTVRPLPAPQGE